MENKNNKILSVETLNQYSNIVKNYIDLSISNKSVQKRINLEDASTNTKDDRDSAKLYVDQNNTDKQVTLQTIKNLNTKILTIDNIDSVNYNIIDKDDYIFIKN